MVGCVYVLSWAIVQEVSNAQPCPSPPKQQLDQQASPPSTPSASATCAQFLPQLSCQSSSLVVSCETVDAGVWRTSQEHPSTGEPTRIMCFGRPLRTSRCWSFVLPCLTHAARRRLEPGGVEVYSMLACGSSRPACARTCCLDATLNACKQRWLILLALPSRRCLAWLVGQRLVLKELLLYLTRHG